MMYRPGWPSTPVLSGAIGVCLFVAGLEPAAQKRYPIFTLNDLVNTMKMVDRNVGGANAALAANDFATAKARNTRAREQLATTITFWRDHKKDDAIKALRTTLARMDDLDTALSTEKVDASAATGLARQVAAACESCHAVYRDRDPATNAYRLKPGTVDLQSGVSK